MECKIFVGLFLLAVLRQVAGVSICPTREIQATEGEVTSPNHPDNYPPDTECSLTIDGGSGARFTVKFLDFRVEEDDDDPSACQYDVFAIIDGSRTVKYCGSGIPPDFKSNRNKIVLKFKSDSIYQVEGFKVTFTSEVEKRTDLSGVSICPSKTIKVNSPEKMKGSFYTPNYPDDYPNNEKCAVILDVPDNYKTTIWFQKFELQYSLSCDFDQLVVSDELQSSTHCGGNANQLPPPLQLKGRQVKMAFSSDDTNTAGGFQLHYNVTRLEEGRCICTSGLSYFTISNYKSKSNRQEDDVRFEFKSTQSSGMIMYAKGFYRDYIYIGYKNGNLLFYNINLGTGEGKIQTTNLKLNDGKWHKVHVTRKNRALTISIDNGRASVVGQTRGPFNRLDVPTSTGYFLGAPSNLELEANFIGCIRDFSVDGIEPITNAKADKPDYSAVGKALARECRPSDLQ